MKLTDAKIVLTGAAGGIGGTVARHLGRLGANLLLTDLREQPLQTLVAALAAEGIAARSLAADITADGGCDAVATAAREQRANVLINAAGVNPFGLLAEQSSAAVEQTLRVNAIAPMLLCQAMLPVLRGDQPAHIVNVGSVFGSIGYPGFCAYSASKFALRGFSEALRRELADTNIRVHYVAPRATRTAVLTDRIRAMNEELGIAMDSPDAVARAIERLLERPRAEVLIGTPERWYARINALLPALIDRSVRKQLPIVRRHAQGLLAD